MNQTTNEPDSHESRTQSETVKVTSSGQATIPKKFRDKLGIDAPGKITFRETTEGDIVIESVPSAAEMAGFAARSGEASTDKPASELLREKREADKDEREST